MKKKALALLLAGSMLFGQNVYATDMASTQKNADANITDITENMSETEHDSEAVIAHDAQVPDNASDDEKLDIMKTLMEKDTYFKGEKVSLQSFCKVYLSDVQASNVDAVDIEKGYTYPDTQTSGYDITMRKEGKVELTLTLNNVIKKVDIVINGIDPNQAAGANNFEQSVIDKYTVDGISSAILTSNGELWQTYPKTKKLQSNVKKYVSRWVYWGNKDSEYDSDKKVCDFRLDNNNILWSGNEKIMDNVMNVEGRYALKNDNTLVDIYHENGDSISDVKDWIESCEDDEFFYNKTIILKTDGTLWEKLTNSENNGQDCFQIDKDVKELHKDGYLKNNGDYVRYGWNNSTASNVSEVDDVNYCLYYNDGSCNLGLDYCSENRHVNLENHKIKDRLSGGLLCGDILILDNNELYVKQWDGGDMTKLGDNFEKILSSNNCTNNIVVSTDGEFFKVEDWKLVKTDKAPIKNNYQYCIIASQNSEYGMLQKNGVDILSNVKDVWNDFALRTDGTIWNVRDIPTLYMDLNASSATPGDVDGDDKVSTKDLMIVLYGVSGRNELTDDQTTAADIDGDGKVTVSDLTRILYYVSGRNSTL